ncbi:hypothetical protein ACFQ4C_30490 [Larkinella insperata]|uniref:Uncharacterized protein n=1 Tax=Larkinella insperata TaxID=332158 RepID=A0ABW3QEW2_9BACT
MSNVDKKVLKQEPLTDEQIERLENYPKAERVNLSALIAKRRQQAEEKTGTLKSAPV